MEKLPLSYKDRRAPAQSAADANDRARPEESGEELPLRAALAETLEDPSFRPRVRVADWKPHYGSFDAIAYTKAEYARQLREQMLADAGAKLQRANNCRSVSSARVKQHDSLPHDSAPISGEGRIDRKTEYARQLREQMLADEVARRVADAERRRPAALAVPPPFNAQAAYINSTSHVVGQIANAKAEYAQQLRDQIAAKKAARREDARRRDGSLPSLPSLPFNDEPAWSHNDDGCSKQRERSMVGYGERVHAQKGRENGIAQSFDTSGDVRAARDNVGKRVEEQQRRHQRERPTSMKLADTGLKGHEQYQTHTNHLERTDAPVEPTEEAQER